MLKKMIEKFSKKERPGQITRKEFDLHLVRALALFGEDKQLNQCLEELGELQHAIFKYKRFGEGNITLENPTKTKEQLINQIFEERVDVYIMLQQLDLMLGLTSERFTEILNHKMNKLNGHIENKVEQNKTENN